MKIFIGILLAATFTLGIRFVILGQKSQEMRMNLGLIDGRLHPSDKASHCFHSDQVRDISSLLSTDKINESIITRLKEVSLKEGLNLEKEETHYLYFTAKSKLFGFVDDIEFYFHPNEKKLHFRSCSRVGNSDLGVNEERIKRLFSAI